MILFICSVIYSILIMLSFHLTAENGGFLKHLWKTLRRNRKLLMGMVQTIQFGWLAEKKWIKNLWSFINNRDLIAIKLLTTKSIIKAQAENSGFVRSFYGLNQTHFPAHSVASKHFQSYHGMVQFLFRYQKQKIKSFFRIKSV